MAGSPTIPQLTRLPGPSTGQFPLPRRLTALPASIVGLAVLPVRGYDLTEERLADTATAAGATVTS
jgi:hypothetical protein